MSIAENEIIDMKNGNYKTNKMEIKKVKILARK
jgi:hypothetical protein